MSVIDRAALQASPLADLHAIASELSIDGYRRLRRPELIDAILNREAGAEPEQAAGDEEEERTPPRRRRSRRGGRGRASGRETEAEEEPAEHEQPKTEEAPAEEEIEGVVELLPNGSGFIRVDPPEPSDADVYISAAQVKRCELVSGDRISGPRRTRRRSERFASLVRVDTVNGRPAEELAEGTRFDDLPAAFPSERFRFDSADPTLQAIEAQTPLGRGSRVTIVGPSGAGKTEALRRLAAALAGHDELQVSVALAGVRPEEIAGWNDGSPAPTASASLSASPDAQAHVVELVVDQARRVAARGANAVVLIDTLDGLHGYAARKALAAARNIVDGGSVTVIATAARPIGGETTVIAMDRSRTVSGRFPALDLVASGTIRAELLVGEEEAAALAQTRAEAVEGRR